MKHTKLFLLIFLLLNIGKVAFAQNCGTGFLGTKTLYNSHLSKLTVAPADYSPVFVNYVGRHGARHLTKEVNTSYAYQLLFQADSLHVLTAKGEELKQLVLNLDRLEKGNVKSISAEGRAELQGIGKRMVQQNPELFNQTANVKVSVTKEIRTAQSAEAFFTGINSSTQNQPIITRVTDDTNLRFYDFSLAYDAYKEGNLVEDKLEKLQLQEHINQLDKAFAERIFKPAFAAKLSPKEIEKFTADVFGFTTIVYSLQNEIAQAGFKPADLNFNTVFTCPELARLGLVDAADDYLKKGPGINSLGIQIQIAVPLLINFIKTTDDFIADGKYNAQLRFAHAETVAPFATLLGISSADKVATDLTKLNQVWQPGNVAPLSSNIQWILYQQKDTKNYLVKVLLNEKEARITSLSTQNFPYYNWIDLRNFYLKKLAGWNVNVDTDMGLYLKELVVK